MSFLQVTDIERAFGGLPGQFEAIDELKGLVAKAVDYVKWNKEQTKDHMKKVVKGIRKWCLKKTVEEFSISPSGFAVRNKEGVAKKIGQTKGSKSERTSSRKWSKSVPNDSRGKSTKRDQKPRKEKITDKLVSFRGTYVFPCITN